MFEAPGYNRDTGKICLTNKGKPASLKKLLTFLMGSLRVSHCNFARVKLNFLAVMRVLWAI